MSQPGWLLIIIGIVFVAVGLVWLSAPSLPWPGRLPGDIIVERESFRFYFPLATCILLSILLTGVIWVLRWLSR